MKGSVIKRGNKWAVVVDVGRDANGKRVRKWHSGFDRKRDAEAARIVGVPRFVVHVTHVLPGVVASASVLATIGIGTSILAAAGLRFLGLGPTEPTPEWGLMLSSGRNLLVQAPWVAVFPGLAITVSVVAVSVEGRRLRARTEAGAA